MRKMLSELGGLALFLRDLFGTALATPGNGRAILGQIAYVSYRSLSTVAFAGVFVGAIIVLQFNTILAAYDAQTFLGGLNTSAIVRQIGPLLISFLLAGKIGAFTAAELGTMRVTEQIDAIESLGVNALQYLVVPRFFGIVISSVFLLGIGVAISIAGSVVVASVACGINPLQFISAIPRFVSFGTAAGGLFKAVTFGLIVGGVSCYRGFTASGGARGVGRAVTQAAVFTNFYIVIFDFLTSQVLEALHSLAGGS